MSILRLSFLEAANDPRNNRSDVRQNTTGSVRLLSPQAGNRLPPGDAPCGRGARARVPRPTTTSEARRLSPGPRRRCRYAGADERDHRRQAARALGDEPSPPGRGETLSRPPALLRSRSASGGALDEIVAHDRRPGVDAPRTRRAARAAAASHSVASPAPRGLSAGPASRRHSGEPGRSQPLPVGPRLARVVARDRLDGRRDGIPSWSACRSLSSKRTWLQAASNFSRRPRSYSLPPPQLRVVGPFERSRMGRTLRLTFALAAVALVATAAALAAANRTHANDTFVFGTEGDPVLLDGAAHLGRPLGARRRSDVRGTGRAQTRHDEGRPAARDELVDLQGRAVLDVQPAQEREVPGRHAVRREGGVLQLQPLVQPARLPPGRVHELLLVHGVRRVREAGDREPRPGQEPVPRVQGRKGVDSPAHPQPSLVVVPGALAHRRTRIASPTALSSTGPTRAPWTRTAPSGRPARSGRESGRHGPFKFSSWQIGNKLVHGSERQLLGHEGEAAAIIFRPIADTRRACRRSRRASSRAPTWSPPGHPDGPGQLEPEGPRAAPPSPSATSASTSRSRRSTTSRSAQAVAYGLDRKSVVGAFYGGRGQVANQFLPPTRRGVREEGSAGLPVQPGQGEGAAAVGGPDAAGEAGVLVPDRASRPYMPDPPRIFQAFAASLEKSGFQVVPHRLRGVADYLAGAQSGQAPLYLLGWTGDWGDPANFLNVHFAARTRSSGSTTRRCSGCCEGGLRDEPRQEGVALPGGEHPGDEVPADGAVCKREPGARDSRRTSRATSRARSRSSTSLRSRLGVRGRRQPADDEHGTLRRPPAPAPRSDPARALASSCSSGSEPCRAALRRRSWASVRRRRPSRVSPPVRPRPADHDAVLGVPEDDPARRPRARASQAGGR